MDLRRIFSIIAVILSALILLSACESPLIPTDKLVRAPKLTGENAAIQQAFEEFVGTGVSLEPPSDGLYRSAFIRYDYDSDGFEEAVAFYISDKEDMICRANFIDMIDGSWKSVADLQGQGISVADVSFADLDGDSSVEMMVGWIGSDSLKDRTLGVYVIDNSSDTITVNTVLVQHYASKLFVDADRDGKTDVFFTDFDTTEEGRVYAELLKLSETGFSVAGVTDLSRNISSFYSFLPVFSDGSFMVYADCLNSQSKLFTELIIWNPDTANLTAPFDADDARMLQLTVRDQMLTCDSFDGSGFTQIPAFTVREGSKTVDSSAPAGSNNESSLPMFAPYVYEDSDLKVSGVYFIDPTDAYMLRLDDDLFKDAYAVYDVSGGGVVFYLDSPTGIPHPQFGIASSASALSWLGVPDNTETVSEISDTDRDADQDSPPFSRIETSDRELYVFVYSHHYDAINLSVDLGSLIVPLDDKSQLTTLQFGMSRNS